MEKIAWTLLRAVRGRSGGEEPLVLEKSEQRPGDQLVLLSIAVVVVEEREARAILPPQRLRVPRTKSVRLRAEAQQEDVLASLDPFREVGRQDRGTWQVRRVVDAKDQRRVVLGGDLDHALPPAAL